MLSYIATNIQSGTITILPIQPTPEDYIAVYPLTYLNDSTDAVTDIISNVPVSIFDRDVISHITRVGLIHRRIILSRLSNHRLGTVFRYLCSQSSAYPDTMAYCVTRLDVTYEDVPKLFPYAHIFGWGLEEITGCDAICEPFDLEYCISLLDPNNMDASVKFIIHMSLQSLASQSLIDWIDRYCATLLSSGNLTFIVQKSLESGINFEQCYNIADAIQSEYLRKVLHLINGTITINDLSKVNIYLQEEIVRYAQKLLMRGCESTKYHAKIIIDNL